MYELQYMEILINDKEKKECKRKAFNIHYKKGK